MIYTYRPDDLGGLEVRATDPETGRFTVQYVAGALVDEPVARRHALERVMAAHGRLAPRVASIPVAKVHDSLLRGVR